LTIYLNFLFGQISICAKNSAKDSPAINSILLFRFIFVLTPSRDLGRGELIFLKAFLGGADYPNPRFTSHSHAFCLSLRLLDFAIPLNGASEKMWAINGVH